MSGCTLTPSCVGEVAPTPAIGGRPLIPTDLLQSFVSICELGSFTKAARSFGLTQPAISAQMKRLESIVGAHLLDRSGPSIRLTARGAEVLTLARRMLALNDRLTGLSVSQRVPVIRVGVPNVFAIHVLRAFAEKAYFSQTETRIQLFCDYSANLLEGIRNGHLELACVISDRLDIMNAVTVWAEEFVWARSPHASLGRRTFVPLISSPNRSLPDRIAMDALSKADLRYEIVFSSYDREARLAAAGLGVGYLTLPQRLVPHNLAIEESGLPPLRSIPAGIVLRAGIDPNEVSPLLVLYRDALQRSSAAADARPAIDDWTEETGDNRDIHRPPAQGGGAPGQLLPLG
jgi:DNA-binding transcriptional LysR family regulator